ncbi:MAG: YfhO family protein [Candidatus Eisenbacteria bacterium]|nr:YfhO family protein [Candidatus Eisenbacteria bacterium]
MKARRFIVLIFLGVALLFFREAAFRDRVEIPCNPNRWEPWRRHATAEEIAPPAVNTDCALAYYPRRVFATTWMRRGELPLWDPTTFCGQPFLADFQSSLLYPVNLALYAMEPMRAMGWFLIIHFVLGGWFAYRAARSFGVGRGGSIAAAVAFELNPFFLTRTGHPTFVATAAWLPMAVFAANRLVRKPGARQAALLAASLALAATAGFPQTLIHVYYAVAWLLFAAWALREGERPGRVLAAGAAAVVLSFALAAFQLLPTAEFLRHSTRDPVDTATFLSGTHHPFMLLRALVPDLFGNPMQENLWSPLFQRGNGLFRQNYVSTLNYFGVLPLVLGLYGIVRGRRRFFLGGLFLLPLLVIWGTPAANLAFHLPGFRFSRPDRLILLPLFAASLGFGMGVDRLARGERGIPRALLAGLVAILLAAAAAALAPEEIIRALSGGRVPPGPVAGTARASGVTTALFALLGIGLVLFRGRIGRRGFLAGAALLAGADLFLFGSRFHLTLPAESTFRETPEIRAIRGELGGEGRLVRFGVAARDFLPPATASLYGIDDTAGINALNLDRYRRLWERVEPGLYSYRRYLPLQRLESLDSPILRLVGGRVWTLRADGAPAPLRTVEPLPRATMHFRWETLPPERILERIGRPGFDPADTLFLEEESPHSPPLVAGERVADTRIERYEPDRVTVRARTPEPAFLLLADAWYPGWTATVDGEAARVYRADYAFRGVHVPAGEHVIDFRYRPASFRAGAGVSAAAVLLTASLAVLGRKRRREG